MNLSGLPVATNLETALTWGHKPPAARGRGQGYRYARSLAYQPDPVDFISVAGACTVLTLNFTRLAAHTTSKAQITRSECLEDRRPVDSIGSVRSHSEIHV